MTAEIFEQLDDLLRIRWEEKNDDIPGGVEFGEVTIRWDKVLQVYILDAEMIGLPKIIRIVEEALRPKPNIQQAKTKE